MTHTPKAGIRTRSALLTGLAAGAGATDAVSFVALGHVFTSVITGNLVLVGVSISTGEYGAVLDIAVALACYVVSTAAAARYLSGRVPAKTLWSPPINRVLAAEALIQAGVLAGWLASGSHPTAWPVREILLGGCALAMGLQSAAVRAVSAQGLSTTYLTGTLTAVVASFATGRREDVHRAGGIGVILSLLAGATLEAALLRLLPALGPALPQQVTHAVALVAHRSPHTGSAPLNPP
jgi:uncharacterized membrane protein YoaK (UPF0700 family)